MQKPKNSRLGQQIKQIKSLLGDFKKVRTKCLDLSAQLRLDLNKDNFYPSTQRTTHMKCELLDLKGLVQLKNSLVNLLGELFEKERDLTYQKQRRQAQKEFKVSNRDMGGQLRRGNQWQPRQPTKDSQISSIRSSRASEMNSSRRVEVPFYKLDQQSVQTIETKLDRVSKFIASLKKSIRIATEAAGCKFRTKQYLLQQEPYLKVRAELQRYQMRQEQLQAMFSQLIKKQVQKHFQENAKLSPQGDHYLIRVPKVKKKPREEQLQEYINPSFSTPVIPQDPQNFNFRKKMSSQSEHIIKSQAQAKANADFEQIKIDLQKRSQNFSEMFIQMNQVVQKGSEKLSELRKKRKQAFKKDDELWDEL